MTCKWAYREYSPEGMFNIIKDLVSFEVSPPPSENVERLLKCHYLGGGGAITPSAASKGVDNAQTSPYIPH